MNFDVMCNFIDSLTSKKANVTEVMGMFLNDHSTAQYMS